MNLADNATPSGGPAKVSTWSDVLAENSAEDQRGSRAGVDTFNEEKKVPSALTKTTVLLFFLLLHHPCPLICAANTSIIRNYGRLKVTYS